MQTECRLLGYSTAASCCPSQLYISPCMLLGLPKPACTLCRAPAQHTALQHLCREQHCWAAAAKHCASLCTTAPESSPIYPLLNQIILCKYIKYFQSASLTTQATNGPLQALHLISACRAAPTCSMPSTQCVGFTHSNLRAVLQVTPHSCPHSRFPAKC